jgi:hypothetical protein
MAIMLNAGASERQPLRLALEGGAASIPANYIPPKVCAILITCLKPNSRYRSVLDASTTEHKAKDWRGVIVSRPPIADIRL